MPRASTSPDPDPDPDPEPGADVVAASPGGRSGQRPVAGDGRRTALGRALAVRRLELGLTRRQVADGAGLSYPFVCEIERGAKQPSAASLRALAAAVVLTPADLLARADALERLTPEHDAAGATGGADDGAHPGGGSGGVVTRRESAWRGPGGGARGGVRAAATDDLAGLVRGLVRDELARLQAGGAPPMAPGRADEGPGPEPLRREDDVRAAVVAAVRAMLGRDDLDFDAEGDIPIKRGDVMLFIRVLDDPLSVLVFAPVLVGVDESLALHERLNELNAGVHFVRFCVTHGGVVADIELFGEHFRAPQLDAACTAITDVVADQVAELQEVVGGRRFFGDETVARPRRDTAGYL